MACQYCGMELTSLIDQNPWWRDKAALVNDPVHMRFKAAAVRWRPRLAAEFDLEQDSIYLLRGPRQVGKSTLLKIMMRDQQKVGVDPKALFYFTCDLVRDGQELVELVRQYLDFSRELGTTGRRYLFLDEVSSIADWGTGVKFLVDTGRLTGCTMVLTGSHALDLKRSSERLPGRRGGGKGSLDKLMLPLSFGEYVATLAPELMHGIQEGFDWSTEGRRALCIELMGGIIPPGLTRLQLYQEDLQRLFDNYLLTGGNIRAVNNHFTERSIVSGNYEVFLHTLMGDLARWRYQERLAQQIIASLLPRMTTTVSLNKVAQENGIGSHNTVAKYLAALEDSFVLLNIHQLEAHRTSPAYRRPRKVYFQDPFIYHALRGWGAGRIDYCDYAQMALIDSEHRSRLVEMVVAEHLARLVHALEPGDFFTPQNALFFWRKKKSQREVDFILRYRERRYPIEVKYRRRVGRKELINLHSFKRGLVVTKDTYESMGRYAAIPVEMFLLLI